MHKAAIVLCVFIAAAEPGMRRAIAAGLVVDPARPFGAVDLIPWKLDQYLTGTQKERARLLFMQQLPGPQLQDLGQRCTVIESQPQRFDVEALAVCDSVLAALNMPKG